MFWFLPEDFAEYEQHVGACLQQQGENYQVTFPRAGKKGLDIVETTPDGKKTAVQVKLLKNKVSTTQIKKFLDFLESPLAGEFAGYGKFVTSAGYSASTIAILDQIQNTKVQLYVCNEQTKGQLHQVYPDLNCSVHQEVIVPIVTSTQPRLGKWFGVFTSKGGVGKTTVAAHLAGALARLGYSVLLLDFDPEQNLYRLFFDRKLGRAELEVPAHQRKYKGGKITVLDYNKFIRYKKDSSDDLMFDFIVADCSPVLKENPLPLLSGLDYVLVPTILNPLGVAKDAGVITRSFKKIRTINQNAKLFCVANSYEMKRLDNNEILSGMLSRAITEYAAETGDDKCMFIDPEKISIRYSDALYNWGAHIMGKGKPELAFHPRGTRSYPLEDFLALAEYLVENLGFKPQAQ